jgi:TolB-like protein
VIHKDGDVFGDAVNIASRLEPLAKPEGICISEQVHDQVRNKVPLEFARMEFEKLKNVDVPIEVYRVVMPWQDMAESHRELSLERIAVLPFANMSPDPGDEYFADGMTEELIERLAQVKGLEVIARTSVMSYKKKDSKAGEIGKELRVGALVEGSVRKSGNRIRVTAQLINANTEGHVWSSHYDKNLDDVFAVQSDIAEKVAEALKIQLLPSQKEAIQKKPTRSTEAHSAYLKGLYFMNRGNGETFPRAIELLGQAIGADPGFAAAYAALADCYTYMAGEYMPSKDAFAKAKPLALKAIELDNTLAEGHTSLGNILLQHEWDWAEAGRELALATELNPSYSNAHIWYGQYLLITRKKEQGVKEEQIAEDLDPLSYIAKLNMGYALFYSGRYAEAIAKAAEAIELESRGYHIHLLKAWSCMAKSDYEGAITTISKALSGGENDDILGSLGYAYAVSGRKKDAAEALARLHSMGDKALSPFTNAGMIQMGLGEFDHATELFEMAAAKREESFVLNCQTPLYDRIRSFPRFAKLIQSVGLPP